MIHVEPSAFSGLPLEEALRRLRALNVEPRVEMTCSVRGGEREGACARVVRVREDGTVITAARFLDAVEMAND